MKTKTLGYSQKGVVSRGYPLLFCNAGFKYKIGLSTSVL